MLQLLPARVGMKRSPDFTLTGLQLALTHWLKEKMEGKVSTWCITKNLNTKLTYIYKNAILECYINAM